MISALFIACATVLAVNFIYMAYVYISENTLKR